MVALILYYLILPFLLFGAVLAFIRKFENRTLPKEIQDLNAVEPIEPKYFRAVSLKGRFGQPGAVLAKLGDFETQDEAVDAAFQARSSFPPDHEGAFLVLSDRGEIIQEV